MACEAFISASLPFIPEPMRPAMVTASTALSSIGYRILNVVQPTMLATVSTGPSGMGALLALGPMAEQCGGVVGPILWSVVYQQAPGFYAFAAGALRGERLEREPRERERESLAHHTAPRPPRAPTPPPPPHAHHATRRSPRPPHAHH
jgi:hypothetical protein